MEPFRRLYLDANLLTELGEGEGEIQRLLFELLAKQMKHECVFLCTIKRPATVGVLQTILES